MKTLNETNYTIYQFFASPFFDLKTKIIELWVSYQKQVKNDDDAFEILPESALIADKKVSIADTLYIFADLSIASDGGTFDIITLYGLSCRQYYTIVEGEKVNGEIAFPAYSYLISTNVIRLFPELQAIIVNCPDEATREALTTLAQQLVYDRIKDQVETFIETNHLA